MSIYLDNSATTPICKQAKDEMLKMITDNYGNPSSRHEIGNNALSSLKNARSRTAKAIGCSSDEIYFTPSGTCANNTAIFGAVNSLRKAGYNRIITSSLEHPSVNEPLKYLANAGFEVIKLPTERDGKISLSALRAALNAKTALVSIMLVNNEIGVINPIEQAVKIVRSAGNKTLFHCDAVQAFGKISVKPSKLGVDMLTVSSHKIHGPKGAGALYIKKGIKIPAYILGGGQENGMFSGTEATPAIAGFGAAAAAVSDLSRYYERIEAMRNSFVQKISNNPHVRINSPVDALPYIINLSLIGVPSEVLINYLSDCGIYVSAGSACKKGHRSEVLTAIGMDSKRIDSAIRISLSRYTESNDLDVLCDKINEASQRFLR